MTAAPMPPMIIRTQPQPVRLLAHPFTSFCKLPAGRLRVGAPQTGQIVARRLIPDLQSRHLIIAIGHPAKAIATRSRSSSRSTGSLPASPTIRSVT